MPKTLNELEGDVIDSRDLIEAMEQWREIVDDEEGIYSKDEVDEAEEELYNLEKFCEPFVGYSDWDYGETIISGDYFIDYVEELISDCGYISKDFPDWIAIDWESTAESVKQDYTPNDYGYWMRTV